jgi:hypothetical protein
MQNGPASSGNFVAFLLDRFPASISPRFLRVLRVIFFVSFERFVVLSVRNGPFCPLSFDICTSFVLRRHDLFPLRGLFYMGMAGA